MKLEIESGSDPGTMGERRDQLVSVIIRPSRYMRRGREGKLLLLLSGPEVTPNLYCNFAYMYWEGCVIRSIYLR